MGSKIVDITFGIKSVPLNKAHSEAHKQSSSMRKYQFFEALESHQRTIEFLKQTLSSAQDSGNKNLIESVELQLQRHLRQMHLLVRRNRLFINEMVRLSKGAINADIFDLSGEIHFPDLLNACDNSKRIDYCDELALNQRQLSDKLDALSKAVRFLSESNPMDRKESDEVIFPSDLRCFVQDPVSLVKSSQEINDQNKRLADNIAVVISSLQEENENLKKKITALSAPTQPGQPRKDIADLLSQFTFPQFNDSSGQEEPIVELAPLEIPAEILQYEEQYQATLGHSAVYGKAFSEAGSPSKERGFVVKDVCKKDEKS